MVDRLTERVKEVYTDKVSAFFERVKAMNLTGEELNAVPSLFIPGWGEDYDSSVFKVAVAGMETSWWRNEYGDSLKCDLTAYDNGQYDVAASCRLFRKNGPAKWRNVFWQYSAAVLARLFETSKKDVLQKDDPLLRSIAWFNSHALETFNSEAVDREVISRDKMALLQNAADECGLSDFETFARVFRPHVILYFYRNNSGVPERNFPKDIEFVESWGDGMVDEYRIDARTVLLHCPHTTYMAHGNMKQDAFADLVCDILKARNVMLALCERNAKCDFYSMSAVEWSGWVEFVRNEAEKYPDISNMALSHHLMSTVARELAKRKATMSAQTLVFILNEVDRFRRDDWLYSPERRGPCASVRGAYNDFVNAGKKTEAKWIARAFTKLNGELAWK